jgi:tetratricopeptide (TPR) repeat protein
VDVYGQLAATLRRLGELREAREAYREAIRRSPQLVDSLALEVAKLELDLGDLNAAELNARQAVKLNPNEAHVILAGIAMERRDFPAAEREAHLAVGDAEKPRVPALIMLARVLGEQGKFGEALAAIDRAKARVEQDGAPPVPTLASTRGDILARLGRDAEAEAEFRLEMQRFPRTTTAYTQLAVLLAQQHRYAEIQPTLEAMVSASPAPATYALAADVLNRLGNTVMARDFQRRGERLAGK